MMARCGGDNLPMVPSDDESVRTDVLTVLPAEVLAELRAWTPERVRALHEEQERDHLAAIEVTTQALDVKRYNLLDLLMEKVVRRRSGLVLLAAVLFFFCKLKFYQFGF